MGICWEIKATASLACGGLEARGNLVGRCPQLTHSISTYFSPFVYRLSLSSRNSLRGRYISEPLC